VHERKLMDDLMQEIERQARAVDAGRVTKIRVRLGVLSHFAEAHFHEHFVDAARGGIAEDAEVETELRSDPTEPEAQGVVLESIEVELNAEASARPAGGETPDGAAGGRAEAAAAGVEAPSPA
jgi:hydrogenase nickel incorporation protein HypA/HybF